MTLEQIVINAPITLGLTGPQGPPGETFNPSAVGLIADRSDFDAEDPGFSFLSTDEDPAQLYFRVGVSGWSAGIDFIGGGAATPANLSTTVTATTVTINNSNGTGFVLAGASGSAAGLMVAADKTKLDGIAAGANNYTLPVATTTVIGGVKRNTGTGYVTGIDADGNLLFGTPSGGGDFVGPAGATANALVVFDGATGKLGKNSTLLFSASLGTDTLESSNTNLRFKATGASGVVVMGATGASIVSQDGTDSIFVSNGEVLITLGGGASVSITDAGMRLNGAGARIVGFIDEDSMASNSAVHVPTQQSVKAYVDAKTSFVTRAAAFSPPNIPQELLIENITSPSAFDPAIGVAFSHIDEAGRPVWEDSSSDLTVYVVGNEWWIETTLSSDYKARRAYAGEVSPVGLTGWTLDTGAGGPDISVTEHVTPTRAGEVVRYGDGPYRYFVANSTDTEDYTELTDWPKRRLAIDAPSTPFSLTAWNVNIGSGGRSVGWAGAGAAAFVVPTATSEIGDQWFATQFGDGIIEITGGSGNRTVVGNPKTGGQNKSVHVVVLENGNVLVTGGVA